MSDTPAKVRVLVYAGSTRTASYNKLLARAGAAALEAAGAAVTLLDLRDLALPLYDGDLEERDGLPEGARTLKRLMGEHDAQLVSAPEYNASITAVLKNAVDWASRAETDDEPPMLAFDGKVVGLVSASPGALGGLRGLVTVRALFSHCGAFVLPEQLSLPRAHEAFDEDGRLRDPRRQAALDAIAARVIEVAARLRGL